MSFKKKKSFTLIELLVVIGIIGILSGIIIVNVNSYVAKARYTKLLSEMTQLEKALNSYYADYGIYPNDVPGNVIPSSPYSFVPNYLSVWPKHPCNGGALDYENWDTKTPPIITFNTNRFVIIRIVGNISVSYCIQNTIDGTCDNSDDIRKMSVKEIKCGN